MIAQWLQEDDYHFLLSGPKFPTLKETKEKLMEQLSINTLTFPTRQTLLAETPQGIPLGFITLARIDWRSRTVAIEAYFDRKYRDTPYPISAGVKAFAYIFQELNLQKIYSFVQGFNTKSLTMHEKYGTKPEAVLKDYIYKEGKYYDMYIFATYRDMKHYKNLPTGLREETYHTFLPALNSSAHLVRLLVGLRYLPERYAAGKAHPGASELRQAVERYQKEHSLEATGEFTPEVLASMINEVYPVLREHYKT
jgi:RimJ/RimL family protein N-acetyltransferase